MLSESKMMSLLHSKERSLERIKERGEEMMHHGLQALEVAGAAAAVGYVNAKFGNADDSMGGARNFLLFQKLPLDLTLGLGLHALAFAGAAGRKYSEALHNIADGSLAVYGYRLGTHMAVKALLPATAATSGTLSAYYPAYASLPHGSVAGPLAGHVGTWAYG